MLKLFVVYIEQLTQSSLSHLCIQVLFTHL